ncbi:MAG: SDR family NAD(P)-dependent oxidoreductase [Microscillaceae bacterium]|nr:SDR family NAD(P)-dependent oxidoreductase [Microscillaceae bacterium]
MNKKILITGATGNLGQSVLKKLKTESFQILATVNSESGIEELQRQGVAAAVLDLTSEQAVKDFIAASGSEIDAAVLLVGGFAMGGLKETDGESIRKMYSLNFETSYFIVKELLPFFEAQGKGQFILIGARPALKPEDGKNLVAYSLTKGLVFQLAEMINAQGKEHNIHATVIVPSTIDTPRNRESMPDADFSHWVSPEAIADTIHFLLMDSGKQIRESVIKLYNRS